MEVIVSIHTYNTYGGNSSISLVGQFLAYECPGFGSAIAELDVHVYFKGGKIKKTLESLFEKYHKFIDGLPSSTFYRKKNRFELNFLSGIGDATLVAGFGPPDFELFTESAKEIVGHFPALKAKLKKSDDFDLQAFVDFIESKIEKLPVTEGEFIQLQKKLEAERERKLASMDEWEKLGIDWIDYHPDSRKILDSPFFWHCADDFSPNGNDTGADVLGFYEKWRKMNRDGDGISFFEKLMADWGVSLPLNLDDDFSRETYEESIVGLAFAQIKIDGDSQQKVSELALKTIRSMRERIEELHKDWDLYDERIRTLYLMETKLKGLVQPTH